MNSGASATPSSVTGQDLLRLDEEGDGDRLVLVHPECDGRRGVRRLEDADVARRRSQREAEIHGEQRGDGGDESSSGDAPTAP